MQPIDSDRVADSDDDRAIARPHATPLHELIDRRRALQGLAGLAGAMLWPGCGPDSPAAAAAAPAPQEGPATGAKRAPAAPWREPSAARTPSHAVATEHRADVLIRWGDPVLGDAPPFDPAALTGAGQAKQFGYNNDFLAFLPLPSAPADAADVAERGLLWANHEYTNAGLMWADASPAARLTPAVIDVEMAAHGGSIVEVVRDRQHRWSVVPDSRYARRITANTPMRIAGPAADDPRVGTAIQGMVNNCAGGVTPWGTIVTAEENFHGYFVGTTTDPVHQRYGVGGAWMGWGAIHKRFNLNAEPNGPYRFGWMVEIDPHDPASVPVKRTAMGRCKHEGAGFVVNHDGRVAAYCGDDQRFEFLYKYVSREAWDPAADRATNGRLLDDGTLYVARFDADGTGSWLPLVFGEGPLTPANGFTSQADVLIRTRIAADALKATPLDRPEDVEVQPASGRVYVMCTNNSARTAAQVDGASPRGPNKHGHVLELTPAGGGTPNHAATDFTWNVLLLGGAAVPGTTPDGTISCPDNAAFDPQGRLWIATDGQGYTRRVADGLFVVSTEGAERGRSRRLFSAPVGAEVCGPCFTPDGRTLFLAVQHPGSDGSSSFTAPSTRWPDFADGVPPRPSVMAITRPDGRPVGG